MNYKFLILFLLSISVWAQEVNVSGTVISADDQIPLPGVSILVKNTTKGVVTDFDGKFTIQNINSDDILVFSYVGFTTQEVPVNGRNEISIALTPDAEQLSEVVVTGYQTERKKDITGAVSVVDVDEMKKQAVANPIKALQGRVAGMNITGNGSPSSPATVRIRGIGTLNNNDPLYIIDGVPTKAGMHELNSQDIESIQVLKDASAASIYGSRAANGVIIVTTKKGQLGKVRLDANVYTSLSSYTSRTEMLDTEGYGRALWQANINNGTDPNDNSVQYRFDWGINPETGEPILNQVLVPEYLDAERTMRASNTDWFDEISRIGVIQNYDVALSNGTENGNYYLSLGYFNNEGVIKTSKFDRFSARLNTDYKFFDGKIVVGENLSLTKTSEVAAAPMNAAMQALPIIPVRTVDGQGWGGPVGGMNDRQNPVRLLEDNKQNGYDFFRLFGSFYAEATILENLNFRTNFGIDYGNYTYRNLRKRYQSGYLNNPVNRVESGQTHNLKTTWTNTLNYSINVKNHSLNAIVGTEFFREKNNNFWASREDFEIEDDAFTYLDAGTGQKDNGGSGAEHVLLSYFGRLNYSFLDKYLISGTLRYDGSSRFGENNRFGTFPAFSVGWRLSEENFIQNNTHIFDELKLRFGWGITGNQEIDNNAIHNLYLTDYNSTSYDINGNGSGVLPSGYKLVQNANPNLRWEQSKMTNFGLDFDLFNHRLYGSAEYYIRETSDILLLPPYIGTLGEGGNQWVNGASMQNKGFELSIGNRTNINEDFRMKLDANLSLYRNEVTVLPNEVVNAYGGDGRGQNILGRPINSFFGYVADGLFQSQEEVAAHAEQPGKGLGRIRYADLNGDGVIDDYDRTWIGTPHPDFTYGLSAEFNYKQFDLSLFLQGVAGVDVINDFKFATDFWSASETGSNKGARLLDAWSPTNTNSDIPMISLVDENWEARFSSYFVENGSYLRLRNAQMGYTLTNEAASKVGMDYFRVYVGGDNLALLLKSKSFTGIDPENPGFGYPNPTVVTAGLNIRF
ncbi:TonB-dependent receptor [Antarcticibacterium flavum]|uniref:TonB-dependent receptor n=1 Tax=Antarcticibacterium flavum TaxID=2058175 RepID=A0A5B7X2U7_9FLAO|nr:MULTISPECIES: TonB-dependent receptor [Antarcticibacterium]MCM4160949.1 SusC/RagA family protein [Antarcticibacterium sp. W02-3]QCY68991.1 TonB-dependent receptor [Antarcticibacterium flavum]